MKKLISIFAVLAFSASVVFAQSNEATVDQTGGNQTSSVTQSGSLNTADVDQFTNNFGPQNSTVLQTGTGNDAVVTQSQTGGGNTGTNYAYIEQVGATNVAFQSETAPNSSSGQNVWGKQIGTSNDLTQIIGGGYTESLKAIQDGIENIAAQYANGSHTHGEIYQKGDFNEAIQYLTGSNNGYMSSKILIDQLGDDNLASQTFNGSGSSHMNNGEIYQTGNENDAAQIGNGRSLNLQTAQTGNFNEASQNATGNNYGLGIGLLDIDQLGNDNEASQTAVGDGIWGKIAQTGDLNVASMSQTGDFNWAKITQTGNSNTASVVQTP